MLAEMLATRTIPPAIFENIGWQGALLILLVILLLFGGKKLPDLARGLARGLRIFKDELEGTKKGIEEPPEDADTAKKDDQSKDEPPKGEKKT